MKMMTVYRSLLRIIKDELVKTEALQTENESLRISDEDKSWEIMDKSPWKDNIKDEGPQIRKRNL